MANPNASRYHGWQVVVEVLTFLLRLHIFEFEVKN